MSIAVTQYQRIVFSRDMISYGLCVFGDMMSSGISDILFPDQQECGSIEIIAEETPTVMGDLAKAAKQEIGPIVPFCGEDLSSVATSSTHPSLRQLSESYSSSTEGTLSALPEVVSFVPPSEDGSLLLNIPKAETKTKHSDKRTKPEKKASKSDETPSVGSTKSASRSVGSSSTASTISTNDKSKSDEPPGVALEKNTCSIKNPDVVLDE